MSSKKTDMGTGAAARIQSSAAKASGGGALKGGFASRVHSAAATNYNTGKGANAGGANGVKNSLNQTCNSLEQRREILKVQTSFEVQAIQMSSRKTYMDTGAAARIQSSEAKASGGGALKGGFASRAQSAAATNYNTGKGANGGGAKSGKK